MKIDVNQIRGYVDLVVNWVHWFVWIAIVVLLASTVSKDLGYSVPYMPTSDAVRLTYIAAIWYLVKR